MKIINLHQDECIRECILMNADRSAEGGFKRGDHVRIVQEAFIQNSDMIFSVRAFIL